MQIAWLNVILFCILSVGHAALMVAIVNRIHAWPLPQPVLHRFRELHDLILVILPVAFAWLAGFRGTGLFFGGSWLELPLSLLVYLVLCGVVALAVPFVAASRYFAGRQNLQIAGHSITIDV